MSDQAFAERCPDRRNALGWHLGHKWNIAPDVRGDGFVARTCEFCGASYVVLSIGLVPFMTALQREIKRERVAFGAAAIVRIVNRIYPTGEGDDDAR